MEELNQETPEGALENEALKAESQKEESAEIKDTPDENLADIEGAEEPSSKEEEIVSQEEEQSSEKEDISKETFPADKEKGKIKLEGLTLEGLVKVLKQVSNDSEWMFRNREVQDIKKMFSRKASQLISEKKASFLEAGGSEMDFYFKPPLKKEFETLLNDYRKRRQKHLKELESNQKANLEKKLGIIEEIKGLINVEEPVNTIYQKFKALQQSWYDTGAVPKFQSQDVWRTYKHHVELFYDFLHLNRELRELDFKYNYEEKLKIIEQAEQLVEDPDIMKASRNLNRLHRLWKDDLGPVAKEHRETLWNRFQEATLAIHKRKQTFRKDMEANMHKNLEAKNVLLDKMRSLCHAQFETHNAWQKALKEMESLATDFKNVGYVPSNQGKRLWADFRELRRTFSKAKNTFYKAQKEVYKKAIQEKKDLIGRLKAVLDGDDWNQKREEVKGIQAAWRKVGFIPRKTERPLWNEFQELAQTFFDRLRSGYQKISAEEKEVFEEKEKFLNALEEEIFPKTKEAILERVEEIWASWQDLGTLNASIDSSANGRLFKTATSLIKKVKMADAQKQELIFECKLIFYSSDATNIESEIKELREAMNSARNEISQLENNLDFFSASTNQENPLYKKVSDKLAVLKSQMELYERQNIRLRKAKKELAEDAVATSSDEATQNADGEE